MAIDKGKEGSFRQGKSKPTPDQYAAKMQRRKPEPKNGRKRKDHALKDACGHTTYTADEYIAMARKEVGDGNG